MPNDNETIDSLRIKISTESDNAVSNITNLTTALAALKNITKGGVGLTTVTRQLERFNAAVSDMPDLSRFEQLRDILAQIKGLGNINIGVNNSNQSSEIINAEEIAENANEATTEIGEIEEALDSLNNNSSLAGFYSEFKKLSELKDVLSNSILEYTSILPDSSQDIERLERLIDDLKYVEYNLENIKAVNEDFFTSGSQFGRYYDEIKNANDELKSFAKTAEAVSTISLDGVSKEIIKVGDSAKKSTGKFKQFFNSIKRIAMYRAIRAVLRKIAEGITEAFKSVYQFDKGLGGEFSKNVDNLRASFGYLTNSIGAFIAPLANMVLPLLTALTTKLGDLSNKFAESAARASGQTQYARAKSDLDAYRKALEKTNKSIGIDELNVVGDQDNSKNFEIVDVGEQAADSWGALTDIITTISKIAAKIKESFGKLIDRLEKSGVFEKILGFVSSVLDIILMITEDTADSVHESLFSFISAIANILDLIGKILPILKPVIVIINTILNAVNHIISIVSEWLNVFIGVIKIVFDLLTLNFSALSEDAQFLVDALKKMWLSVAKFFVGIFDGIINFVLDGLNFVIGAVENVANFFGADWNFQFEHVHFADMIGYASGGYDIPNGQLFIANEAGAEMVGSMNGHTTVANNQQIVEGVAEGVYQAVVAALGSQNNNQQPINLRVYLDGKQIAASVNKVEKESGARIATGGLIYGV